ncbi:MAG TPA: hypothetical protein DET40_24695 [Lentisphaeria bacterium]|nr:MAG: hypothetical protein A2X45_01310 [Lentisphaerae bacterium GWF2_50_93]HCE46759.1 hypothetical protein [Lentisphaeria bacterium]
MWGSLIRDNELFAYANSRKGHLAYSKHPIDSSWHVQSAVWKSDDAIDSYLDGINKTTSSGANAEPDRHNFLLIGGRDLKGTHPFTGEIAEIIIYSRELSDTDRQKVEAYFNLKYFSPEQEEDSDHDGLLDSWEMKYFGNLNQGAHDDPDGDGIDNITEFKQGRHPNAGSRTDTENRLQMEAVLPTR